MNVSSVSRYLFLLLTAVVVGCEKPKDNPAISWENPEDIQYGTVLSAEQLNATSSVPGTFAYRPALGAMLNPGSEQALNVFFSPEDKDAYNEVEKTVYINVLKGAPEIEWEVPESIVYGDVLTETLLNAKVYLQGVYEYDPPVGTLLEVGDGQELSVTFTPYDSQFYDVLTKTVHINVLKRDPVITWKQPFDLFFPIPITSSLLNATADVDGEFTYASLIPGVTIMMPGKRELLVQFKPTDTDRYNTVNYTNYVNVQEAHNTIVDIEGNEYPTVKIGDQEWMGQNLRTKTLNDGAKLIEYTMDNFKTVVEPGYMIYGYAEDDFTLFGPMYNTYAVNTDKLCPQGWHVPYEADWRQLVNYVRDNGWVASDTYNENYPQVAKALISQGWTISNGALHRGSPADTYYSDFVNKTGLSLMPIGWYENDYDPTNRNDQFVSLWARSLTPDVYIFKRVQSFRNDLIFGKAAVTMSANVRCIKD